MGAAPHQAAEAYWNAAAETYAQAFTDTLTGHLWRRPVWKRLDKAFAAGSHVLELNCGTGIDALHLAHRGVSVLACDLSSRMIELARQRSAAAAADISPEFRVLPTECLGTLPVERLYDGAFSNFSGLNCVADLALVRQELASRLKPGAPLLLCMLGRFGLWHKLKQLRHAEWTRVLRSDPLEVAGGAVRVHSPSHQQIVALFAPEFRLRRWRGIGILVPPAYLNHWAKRYGAITRGLGLLEGWVGSLPGFRNLGECLLLEFERIPVVDQVACS